VIVQRVFHLFDLIEQLFAQLTLKVRVHVASVNDKRCDLQKSRPGFVRHSQHFVASDDDDFRFHVRSFLFNPNVEFIAT